MLACPGCLLSAPAVAFAAPAKADRDAAPKERTRIEAKSAELGVTSWEKIELTDDNSAWEVEDARAGDREYELKLHPDTLEVLKQERH